MSAASRQYPFLERDPQAGAASLAPILPITLMIGAETVAVSGLVDSGSMVNVLPYAVGTQLGAIWDRQTTTVRLAGNLAKYEARGLVVSAIVGDFPSVRLAFAWVKMDAVPVLLGQMNFFLEFDVCLYRARSVFELRPRSLAELSDRATLMP